MYRQKKLWIASCALAIALGFTTAANAATQSYVIKGAADLERVSAAADEIERRAQAREAKAEEESFGLAAGVSQATLDAIAACESGGDPTVVDASGTYYGKYQFSLDTWAAVGGSGSPAEASEAEQDYRASLLYSQAGSSPWPVCGV